LTNVKFVPIISVFCDVCSFRPTQEPGHRKQKLIHAKIWLVKNVVVGSKVT